MTVLLTIVLLAALAVLLALQHPAFGRLPSGERLRRIERSSNYRDGAFRNLHPTPQIVSRKGFVGTMWEFLFRKDTRLEPSEPIPVVKTDLKELPREADVLVWFGHASCLLQTDGVRVLVDPVLTSRWPMSWMFRPFPGSDAYAPEDIPAVDILLITHDHWDHLDYHTLRQLKERIGRIVCPLGVGAHLEYWGFDPGRITEMDWDENTTVGDGFTVHCLPARHFSGRTLVRNRTLWASFLLKTPSRRIFLSGDGGYDTHFARIGERFAPIDLAVLENGQYNADWRYIHVLPEEQARVIRDLNPDRAVSVHHSKYALSRHPWDEPLELLTQTAQRDSLPLLTPRIGEVVFLNDTDRLSATWWKTEQTDTQPLTIETDE